MRRTSTAPCLLLRNCSHTLALPTRTTNTLAQHPLNLSCHPCQAAEAELKTLAELSGGQHLDHDLIRHNLVVFRGGENALQVRWRSRHWGYVPGPNGRFRQAEVERKAKWWPVSAIW